MKKYDLVVVGAGPAGLAAAIEAYESGIRSILVIEREKEPGGILVQCIHTGFGLHTFNKDLTGPEYAAFFIKKAKEYNIKLVLDTMVIDISKDKIITAVNRTEGLSSIQAKAVVLAMGCRERTRGALRMPGTRTSGVFTAGSAQKFVNIEGYMPGEEIVILGSGDIGLIMARRLTLEGAKVKVVCELNSYPGGLTRNIVQCLNDFDIPLRLSHTVTRVHGKDRVTGVTIAQVDEGGRPLLETEEFISCDTLLLSVGLIPENELSTKAGVEIDPVTGGAYVNEKNETNIEGIFACGNVLHVHDLVDYVSEEGKRAGRNAADYINVGNVKKAESIKVEFNKPVRYVVPQFLSYMDDDVEFFFRVDNVYEKIKFSVTSGGNVIKSFTKTHLVPGEMQNVRLKKEELLMLKDSTLKIETEY